MASKPAKWAMERAKQALLRRYEGSDEKPPLGEAFASAIEQIWNDALKAAERAIEDTDVVTVGTGWMEVDSGQDTLRAAAKAVRAIRAAGPEGKP